MNTLIGEKYMSTNRKKTSLVSVFKNLVNTNKKDLNDMLVCSVKVFDTLSQPYFIFDREGTIAYANAALLKTLNLEEAPENIFALTSANAYLLN